MRDFFYHAPDTLDDALALLDRHGEDARVMSGGTALVVLMKQSLVQADHLVSLRNVPGLSEITQSNGELHIGALVRHREVETSALVQQAAPLVAEVYGRVATVRIRSAATVGGGLAHADPAQDPPPGLMVLDATVRLVSSSGERLLPVSELFLDYYETAIRPDEIMTELIVPVVPSDARTVYLTYLPRTADDYPTVSVAALARVEDGRCQEVRVALGASAPTPIRATAVEEAIRGQEVSQANVQRAAEAVADQVDPLDALR
ncbi:MAG: xanthine dehydrogenase family protein subunit M, partial [Chloroflexi bacterium]|nr:xanthine dehydrogenase family protein subunit M [Chloroflexota bacterium]